MATEYSAAVFSVDPKNPGDVLSAIQSTLSQQGQEGWTLSWITEIAAGNGLLIVTERPSPPVAPPKGSLGGYP